VITFSTQIFPHIDMVKTYIDFVPFFLWNPCCITFPTTIPVLLLPLAPRHAEPPSYVPCLLLAETPDLEALTFLTLLTMATLPRRLEEEADDVFVFCCDVVWCCCLRRKNPLARQFSPSNSDSSSSSISLGVFEVVVEVVKGVVRSSMASLIGLKGREVMGDREEDVLKQR
jgi:hypothetical protein